MPIVTNPTAGDVHVNTPLTNFSQKYLQNAESFIALRAMPNMPVAKQSDLYYTFAREDFFRDEAKERADGAETEGGGFSLSTDPYFARVYGFHKDVTDRQRANQDSVIQLDQSATQYVSHKLLIRRERLFADAYLQASVWGTDNALGTATDKWDDASSDPIEQARTAIRTVQGNTGYRPNRAIVGRSAWDALLDNDAILSRITGGSNNAMPAAVQRQLVAQLFEIDEIFVADAVYNSANKGATEATDFVVGDVALFYYAPPAVGLEEPTAGTQFSWTGYLGATPSGQRIKRFRVEANAADRIEGEMAVDYKVVAPELGYFFSNTNT